MGNLVQSKMHSNCKSNAFNAIIGSFLTLALVLSMAAFPAKQADAATRNFQFSITYKQSDARSMLSMVNSFRASNAKCWNESDTAQVTYSGLSPLTYDYKLEQVAMQRAAEIAVNFSHTRPNGETCFTAFPDNVYYYGENIAFGQRSAQEAYMDWREDNDKYDGQGHRRNMLGSGYTSIGIACVEVDGVKFWVQNFGSPNTGAAQTPAVNSQKQVSVDIDQNDIYHASLSLSSTKASLKVGGTMGLPQAKMAILLKSSVFGSSPDLIVDNPAWTSSKPAVAQISGGKIVAKSAGTATLTATVNGVSAKLSVTVAPSAPAKPTLSSVKSSAARTVLVKWKKPSKKNLANIKGYQILCSTSKSFKSGKVTKTAKKAATSLKVKGLKSKKKYYVKVRAFNKANGATSYSNWSKTKTVKVR